MNDNPTYDIGTPTLQDIWVDPVHGDDTRAGTSRATALRTLEAAWRQIPELPAAAGHGWQVLLCPGRFEIGSQPHILLADRRATPACPILIRPADAPLSAELPAVVIEECRALYLIDLKIRAHARADRDSSHNYVLWIADSEDMLVRSVDAAGVDTGHGYPSLVFKANQTARLYVEDCHLFNAYWNALDYVACQYGHIVRSRMHDTRAECMYVKGGSAYFLIARNELYNSKNHGILAGQGTGFQYMVNPWLHHEAYDIKIVNNVIHDAGSAFAVAGGYNILIAWNTAYRVGDNRDTVVITLGGHGWREGDMGRRRALMAAHFRAGGWCNPGGTESYNIPCRNVRICNNLIFNPDGYESRFAHFGLAMPVATPAGSNIPSPARADNNLDIRGNLIWNGPADKPLFDALENEYNLGLCPTFPAAPLLAANAINTRKPALIDPDHGDYRPVPNGTVFATPPVAVPDFTWEDAPQIPPVPPGNLDNAVPADRLGKPRTATSAIGAFA